MHQVSQYPQPKPGSAKRQPQVYTTDDPRYRRRLWVTIATPRGPQLVIAWHNILLLFVISLVSTWLVGSVVIYNYTRFRNPGAEISYLNVVWPLRWPQLRDELGQHYLSLGDQAFAWHDEEKAVRWYTAGLARSPDDLTARSRLSQIYISSGRWQLALQYLQPGLVRALGNGDRDYLQRTFDLLVEAREYSRILELATQLLPAQADARPLHQLIARAAAEACFEQADFEGALRWVSRWRLDASVEGQLLVVDIDVQRGKLPMAIGRLQDRLREEPGEATYAKELLRLLRLLGRHGEALLVAEQRAAAEPRDPGARLDLCTAWLDLGDYDRMQAVVKRFLVDFGTQPTALRELVELAVRTAQPAVVLQVKSVSAGNDAERAFYDLALVQAYLQARRYSEALATVDDLLEKKLSRQRETLLIGLRAVASFGLGYGSEGTSGLQKVEERQVLPAEDVLGLAMSLTKAGAPAAARKLLQPLAVRNFTNSPIVTELIRLDLQLNDSVALVQDLPLLLALPRAPTELLRAASPLLDERLEGQAALGKGIKAALARSGKVEAVRQEPAFMIGKSMVL